MAHKWVVSGNYHAINEPMSLVVLPVRLLLLSYKKDITLPKQIQNENTYVQNFDGVFKNRVGHIRRDNGSAGLC